MKRLGTPVVVSVVPALHRAGRTVAAGPGRRGLEEQHPYIYLLVYTISNYYPSTIDSPKVAGCYSKTLHRYIYT